MSLAKVKECCEKAKHAVAAAKGVSCGGSGTAVDSRLESTENKCNCCCDCCECVCNALDEVAALLEELVNSQ